MKKIESADSSSFSCLPDDILLQILSRLIDLKTLCRCKLVSIRFNRIVQQVNAISVTITSVDRPSIGSNSSSAPSKRDRPVDLLFKCESVVSVMKSLQTFSALKSLCIEIPPIHKAEYTDSLFKWKYDSDNNTRSFLFLSPNSICDAKENVRYEEEEQEVENVELSKMKLINAMNCMVDGLRIHIEMKHYMKCFPLLENVTITDTGKRGRLSLCGEKIVLKSIRNNERMRPCYVPLLKLPVTGYMMKGVFVFQSGDDSSVNMNLNDFEDKEEAAYNEAVTEILKKNRDWKERLA